MSIRKTLSLALCATTLFAAGAAHATVQLFSDAAAFQAALTSSVLEDFTDTTLVPGLSFECNNCSIDLGSGTFVDQAVSGIGARTRIHFATPMTAWGANVDETPGGPGRGLAFTYRLDDGFTTRLVPVQLDDYAGGFFGFISDEAFVFVEVFPGSAPGNSERYAMDNMRFGQGVLAAAPSGAPEPEAWALMLAGFGGVGALLRRRRWATA